MEVGWGAAPQYTAGRGCLPKSGTVARRLGHRISARDAPPDVNFIRCRPRARDLSGCHGIGIDGARGWWLAFAPPLAASAPPLPSVTPRSRQAHAPVPTSHHRSPGRSHPLSVDDLVAYFRSGAKDRARVQDRHRAGENRRSGRRPPGPVRRGGGPGRAAGAAGGAGLQRHARGRAHHRARAGRRPDHDGAGRAARAVGRGALHRRRVRGGAATPTCARWPTWPGRWGSASSAPACARSARSTTSPGCPSAATRSCATTSPATGGESGLAHQMMKLTATVQANFDYAGEADAADKIRTAYGVTSIVTALFAASPIAFGRPNGFKSYRAAIWLETDADRCGLLPFVFKPDFRFRDYVEWALDVPMFFVVRDGVYRPADAARPSGASWPRDGRGSARRSPTGRSTCRRSSPRCASSATSRSAAPTPGRCRWRAAWARSGAASSTTRRRARAAYALVADRTFEEREALRREVPRAGLAAPLRRPLAARAGRRALPHRRGRPRAAAGRRRRRRAARAALGLRRRRGARRPTTCSTTSTPRAAIRRRSCGAGNCEPSLAVHQPSTRSRRA